MSRLIKIAFVVNFCLVLFTCTNLQGQITTNELPPSFYSGDQPNENISSFFALQKPNISAIQKEDLVADQNKEIPWRFGVEEKVNANLLKDASWDKQADGKSSLHLAFYAPQAKSINLNFKQFKLSPNAKLFFYNSDYSDILGAISAKNNKEDLHFSTRPIFGEILHMELICPDAELEQNSLILEGIVYGYRSLKDKGAKTFGSSGNCNIDVNCPEGSNWQDVKRSVVMLLTANNTRFCTGTLVNNVRQDSTPYILTAAHCGAQNNSIFVFNYESPSCNPSQDGTLSNSISGATSKAAYGGSDFHLFELSSTPPASYGVFYSGWNASNVATAISTAIHHPSGDVMKISLDTDLPTTSGYYTPNGTSHWTVSNWEQGTTEGGSSGSALFDTYQRIIGQLHGGNAACSNNAEDYYGKFAISWNSQSSSSQQLKTWLDPDNTGTLTLNGLDPIPSAFNADVGIIGLENIEDFICGDSIINPNVLVKNYGNDTITSMNIQVLIPGYNPSLINWTGVLARNGIVSIPFQSPVLLPGQHNMTVSISSSSPSDGLSTNNSISYTFFINPDPIIYNLLLKTDNYGDETSWDITENGQSIVISSGGPYAQINGGASYTETLCLYDSCFNFNIYDSFGDGFNDPTGNYGNGFVLIRDSNGDTAVFENNFTGAQKTLNFCVPSISTSLQNLTQKEDELALFPNPILENEKLNLIYRGKHLVNIFNIKGQLVQSFNFNNSTTIDLNLEAGLYVMRVSDINGNRVINEKLIVQ